VGGFVGVVGSPTLVGEHSLGEHSLGVKIAAKTNTMRGQH
jgi:hypothetical protein